MYIDLCKHLENPGSVYTFEWFLHSLKEVSLKDTWLRDQYSSFRFKFHSAERKVAASKSMSLLSSALGSWSFIGEKRLISLPHPNLVLCSFLEKAKQD